MYQNKLLLSVIKQLSEDKELSQLSIVMANTVDEFNSLMELAETQQERDQIRLVFIHYRSLLKSLMMKRLEVL